MRGEHTSASRGARPGTPLTDDMTVTPRIGETCVRHRPPQLLTVFFAISPDSSLDAISGMYHPPRHRLKSRSPTFCTHPHVKRSLCGVIIALPLRFSISGIGPRDGSELAQGVSFSSVRVDMSSSSAGR